MTEFLNGLGLLCATVVGAAGVSFGLYAGFQAAVLAFGPINVKLNIGHVHVTNTYSSPPGSEQ